MDIKHNKRFAMLPNSYGLPAALLLILSGTLACFAGYRLFRVVLAIYGFILGAMLTSSLMGVTNTFGMIAAAVVGGLVGALILVFAYFVAIALVGAGMGALIANLAWGYMRTGAAGDPPPAAVIVLAIVGAIGAMVMQRYVMILGTSFGGAWTLIVGALALVNRAAGRSGAANAAGVGGGVWILYPTTPALSQQWLTIGWIALGVVGTVVQLSVTGRKRK
jgi:hypothetical protein